MQNQLAQIALKLIESAPIRGGEAEVVVEVKSWLRQIAAGQLLVGAPAPAPEKEPVILEAAPT